MSDDRAVFGLELLDKMSGPAEKIIGGLEGATGALEKLHGTSGKASEGMTRVGKAVEYMTFALRGIQIAHGVVELSKALGGFDKLKSGIKGAGQAVRRFGQWAAVGLKRIAPFAAGGAGLYGLGKIATGIAIPAMGATAAGIGAVGLAATGAVLAVGYLSLKLAGLAAGGVKAAASFAVFGQDSRMAFGALAKYGASSDRLFSHARSLADEFGLDVRDTTNNFRDLLGAGFNPKLSTDIIKMGADLRFFGRSAEQIKGAVRAITQIEAAGRLQGDEVNQLSEAGVNAKYVYAALARQLGKTVPQVMKLKEAGKLDSRTAITGILQAVKDSVNEKELGDVGKKWADSSVNGMIGRITAKAENLAIDIGDTLTPTLSRLAHGALDWLDVFTKSGRASALIAKIGDTFGAVGDVMVKVMPMVTRFMDGFGAEATTAFSTLSTAVTAMGGSDGKAAGEMFERVGRGVAQIVIYGGAAVGAVGSLFGAVSFGASALFNATLGLPMRMGQVGLDMALGLARGIRDGVVHVVGAIQDMADAAVGKLRGFLDIRSPSRVFGELGTYTAMGFALGIGAGSGAAADAGRDMAIDTAAATSAAMPRSYAPASGAPNVGGFEVAGGARGGVFRPQIIQHIDGSGLDANQVAAISARETTRALEAFMRQFDNEA